MSRFGVIFGMWEFLKIIFKTSNAKKHITSCLNQLCQSFLLMTFPVIRFALFKIWSSCYLFYVFVVLSNITLDIMFFFIFFLFFFVAFLGLYFLHFFVYVVLWAIIIVFLFLFDGFVCVSFYLFTSLSFAKQ